MRRIFTIVCIVTALSACGERTITSTPDEFAGKYPFKDCDQARRGVESTAEIKTRMRDQYKVSEHRPADKEHLDSMLTGLTENVHEIKVMYPTCFDQKDVRASYKALKLPIPDS